MTSPRSTASHISCVLRLSPAIGMVMLKGHGCLSPFPVIWAGSVMEGDSICRLGVRMPLKARRRLRRGQHFQVRFFTSGKGEQGSVWHCRYLERSSNFNLMTLRGEVVWQNTFDGDLREK